MFDFDPDSVSMPTLPNTQGFNYGPSMTAFGGGLGAMSQYLAGQQSASLLRANAAIAGLSANSEQQAGAEQAELYRQHLNATLGRQQASIGGSGITASGSALRALTTTTELGQQDIQRIQTNAARKAWGFQVSQEGDLVRAREASAAGTANAVGALITTGAKAYGQWAD